MDTTVFDPTQGNSKAKKVQNNQPKGHGAVAGVTGAVLGASGAVIIGKISDEVQAHERPLVEESVDIVENNGQETVEGAEVTYNTPSWAVGDIQVAEGVEDSMSFSQAFAAARSEVGPGGAFEWHGNVYGTYSADEWNAMSPAEKADYNNHFNWNNVDTSSNNGVTGSSSTGTNEVEVVSVLEDSPLATETVTQIEIVDMEPQPEIEVLGVVHDHETGANIGGITVDGQEVFLVDVDGDLEFDIVTSDLNHNGQLDEGEAYDIHGGGLTVDHLGGFSDPNDAIQASDDYIANNDYPVMDV
ncbi:MAG: hypothetical protein J1D77_05475 [Muribaculaceae bacterium]|nr:hypothetical protein [Muribaculaceae bacterium]